jgi:uncharacterized protein (TIGR03790 family)
MIRIIKYIPSTLKRSTMFLNTNKIILSLIFISAGLSLNDLSLAEKVIALPSVNIKTDSFIIAKGTPGQVTWSSEDSTECSTSWGENALSGTYTTPALFQEATFWVQCTNRVGQAVKKTVTISPFPLGAVLSPGPESPSDSITYPSTIATKPVSAQADNPALTSKAKWISGVSVVPAMNPAPAVSLAATSAASSLNASQVGLLVNDNDLTSIEIANYYKAKRAIPEANIVHLKIPIKNQLTRAEFAPFKTQVDAALPANVQVIAIAWTNPSRVDCNSITSAFARGFMGGPCDAGGTYPTCGFATSSPYYDSISKQPYTDYKMRPAMMLAGKSVADVKAMIDRGVASDNTRPKGKAHLMKTSDSIRSLRAAAYPADKLGTVISPSVNVQVTSANSLSGTTDTLFYFQGLASVSQISTNSFPPGAVADHLTSYGGRLTDSSQMSCLEFTSGGATGTFGTVTEPCAYGDKFPDPEIMIRHYTQGETLIEAYWKSISQTFQGIFVGEPLAKPWGSGTAPTPATYYVDSKIGNDSFTGTAATATSTNGPWKTLNKLATVNLLPGDTIRLACGSVWNETLKINSSGTADKPIIITANPNGCTNRPIIDGSVTIPATSWTKYNGNIYRAPLNIEPQQLNSSAGTFTTAHFPNKGFDPKQPESLFLHTAGQSDSVPISTTRFGSTYILTGADLILPAGGIINADTKIRIRTNSWTMEEKTVTGFANSRISLGSMTDYVVNSGWGYYLLGQLWMLDSPGEWFYDKASKTIYAWMPDSLVPSVPVTAAYLPTAIELEGKSYVQVDGIAVKYSGRGINMRKTTGTIIRNSVIEDVFGKGITASGSQSGVIENNVISRTAIDAINGAEDAIASGLRVSANRINSSGVLLNGEKVTNLPQKTTAAILAGEKANVLGNTIENTGYIGIYPYKNSIVDGNYLYNVCLVLDDCGGIYTSGSSDSVITNNIIKKSVGALPGKPATSYYTQAQGIYLDEAATSVTVKGIRLSTQIMACKFTAPHKIASRIINFSQTAKIKFGCRKPAIESVRQEMSTKMSSLVMNSLRPPRDHWLFFITPTSPQQNFSRNMT